MSATKLCLSSVEVNHPRVLRRKRLEAFFSAPEARWFPPELFLCNSVLSSALLFRVCLLLPVSYLPLIVIFE